MSQYEACGLLSSLMEVDEEDLDVTEIALRDCLREPLRAYLFGMHRGNTLPNALKGLWCTIRHGSVCE
jgi:hypothetical protein